MDRLYLAHCFSVVSLQHLLTIVLFFCIDFNSDFASVGAMLALVMHSLHGESAKNLRWTFYNVLRKALFFNKIKWKYHLLSVIVYHFILHTWLNKSKLNKLMTCLSEA